MNLDLRLDELKTLLHDRDTIPRVYTEGTYDFVSHLLGDFRYESVLDYSAIPQSFIFRIAEGQDLTSAIARPASIHGQFGNLLESSLSEHPRESQSNHCRSSDVRWLETPSAAELGRFALVLGVLENLSDLEHALEYLRPDGVGLFHVPTYFFRSIRANGPYGEDYPFYIQAAFIHPSAFLGTYYVETYDDEYLILLTKEPMNDLFVAHVTDDESKNRYVLHNFRRRENGHVLKYGFLTDVQYPSMNEFRYLEEAVFARDQLGFSTRANEVVSDIEFLADRIESTYDAGSVITVLPKSDALGTGNVRIALDSSVMLPEFLNLYMERMVKVRKHVVRPVSEEGKILLARAEPYRTWLDGCKSRDEVMHRILNTPILLPDIAAQKRMVRLSTLLSDLSQEVEILENALWTEKKELQEIEMGIDTIGRVDPLEAWTSNLPYPLASVFQQYMKTRTSAKKLEYLLDSMEVFPELFSILILSAVSSDISRFDSFSKRLFDDGPVDQRRFLRPGMGSWVYLGSKVADLLRESSEKYEVTAPYSAFGGLTRRIINTLTNQRLWSLFAEASQMRNLWRGHSGRASGRETDERLTKLEQVSKRIRWEISDSLEDLRLMIRREEDRYRDRVHRYHVVVLRGAGLHLEETVIETTNLMESDEVYMLGEEGAEPVRLLPLMRVRFKEGDEIPVCYFYNRKMSDNDFRYVTYQFHSQSEIHLPASDIVVGLQALGFEWNHLG